MTINKKFLITAALGAISCGAQASPSVDELLTAIRDKCGEDIGTVSGTGGCELEKEREYGKQLAQVYAKAITVAGKDLNLLRKSQISWAKYQRATCDFYQKYYAFGGPGIARAAAASCLLRTTLQRLEELREIEAKQ